MRSKNLGLAALVAAMAVLPTLTTQPASAQSWFQRTFLGRSYSPYTYNNGYNYNNTYNPYLYNTNTFSAVTPYGGTGVNMNQLVSSGQISKAQHDAWVNSINQRVASGQLTLSEGNMILTRGFE
jgi:hypothetical protein